MPDKQQEKDIKLLRELLLLNQKQKFDFIISALRKITMSAMDMVVTAHVGHHDDDGNKTYFKDYSHEIGDMAGVEYTRNGRIYLEFYLDTESVSDLVNTLADQVDNTACSVYFCADDQVTRIPFIYILRIDIRNTEKEPTKDMELIPFVFAAWHDIFKLEGKEYDTVDLMNGVYGTTEPTIILDPPATLQ